MEGTLPQHRVIKLSPRPVNAVALEEIFEDAMSYGERGSVVIWQKKSTWAA